MKLFQREGITMIDAETEEEMTILALLMPFVQPKWDGPVGRIISLVIPEKENANQSSR